MIHLTHKLPNNNEFYIACSGGVDSISVLHWLSRSKRLPKALLYVHHNTGDYADTAEQLVKHTAMQFNVAVYTHYIVAKPNKGDSKESWWRDERYNYFNSFKDFPIILAHNLDDCVEQYIMSTLIRLKKYNLIAYHGPSNTIRPFRTWKKSEIYDYAKKNNLNWIEDPSNTNNSFVRNKIRNIIVPQLLKINPGLYSQIKSMIINEKNSI